MLIEGICVSSHYEDYLVWCLSSCKHIFDRLVVVTSDQEYDNKTETICKHFHTTCIRTNVLNEKFNKGMAINIGLNQLSGKGWIVHFDSDIIFPPRTREMLGYTGLKSENVYGAIRLNCVGYDNWIKYFTNPEPIYQDEIFIHLNKFPAGTLVSKTYTCARDGDLDFERGWIPVGYFQMWNQSNGIKRVYPVSHTNAGRSDCEFIVKNWPKRENRVLIPELVLIHLCTEDGTAQGVNWSGRASKRFGPNE